MPRMSILNTEEKEAFDSPPIFNSVQRKRFFSLTSRVASILETLRTPTNKVCFVVSLGYFKATKRFFGRQFRHQDIEDVTRKLGFLPWLIETESYSETTSRRHQKLIRDLLGFRQFEEQEKQFIAREIRTMIRSQSRPKFILFQVLQILENRKTEIPSAWSLSELILDEIKRHKQELTIAMERHLPQSTREFLDALLEKPQEDDEGELKWQRSMLALMKRISQSTKPSKVKATVEDFKTLRSLYRDIEPVIESLDLTHEGVRYYANSVIKSRVFQVSQRSDDDRHLHLVCFVAHQVFRLQDSLLDVFLSAVRNAVNACEREHKEQYYSEREQRRSSVGQFLERIDSGAFVPLGLIESIAFSSQLSDPDKVRGIQEVLTAVKEKRHTAAEQLVDFKRQTQRLTEDADYYEILESKSLKLQNRVSDIVKCVEFHSDDDSLMAAIRYYKEKGGTVNHLAPTSFLTEQEQKTVFDPSGKFRVSLYKALLFLKMAEAIKAGALNLRHSYKYRSLDDYLLPKKAWQSNRRDYLERAEMAGLTDCDETLETLASTLEERYHHTNSRILTGSNSYVRFFKDGKFHVTTPKLEDEETEPLSGLFPDKRYISLLEVLSTINRITHFLDAFEHWQTKYTRARPSEKMFLAGIVGYGCFIGTRKIANISHQINESELENTVNWYFSKENIDVANDRILQLMDQLELPEVYSNQSEVLHTSSDGQKFEVAVDSLNANYSFKYFGQSKGVSAYNFIDERHFLFHSTVISSAEREAAYVIDGLMHNDVVKSDIHSTDTHGYSEIIFGVMHLLGFSFAPRLRKLKSQRLYSFQKRKFYSEKGYRILPDAYINIKFIRKYWDDILRFVATIKLREATASQLFKRLNSYSKQHPLYRALKEFGKIAKSDFILRYVDILEFRQAIEIQLNKIESSNKFSRAISFGNNQEFLHGEKIEQEMAEGCRRLIKNAITCWNYLYLSQQILQSEDLDRRQELIEAVKSGSVVAWQHINLHGEYDFSDEKLQDSVGLETPKILELSLT